MAVLTTTTPIPVLEFTGSGFDATRVFDPAVVYANHSYTMLFAGLPFGNNVQIGLATSTDGVNWTAYSGDPVISNADSQAWASFREFPAALIYANGAYKTWLNGDNSDLDTDPGYGTGFGLATSPHAVNWTMSAANPIRWELNVPNGTSLDLVGVVALNGRYDAYYLSNTPAGAVVETAASVNGATFSGDQPVVAPQRPRPWTTTRSCFRFGKMEAWTITRPRATGCISPSTGRSACPRISAQTAWRSLTAT
jgi:hypothetical protein